MKKTKGKKTSLCMKTLILFAITAGLLQAEIKDMLLSLKKKKKKPTHNP